MADAAAAAAAAAAAYCEGALYPELCEATLSTVEDLHKKPLAEVICEVVNSTEDAVLSSAANCSSYLRPGSRYGRALTPIEELALGDCLDLLDFTMDELRAAAAELTAEGAASDANVSDVQTALSAAMTNQYTCLDGFSHVDGAAGSGGGWVRPYIEGRIDRVAHLVSHTLAMVKKLPRRSARRGALEGYGAVSGGFPRWVSPADRRLLQVCVFFFFYYYY